MAGASHDENSKESAAENANRRQKQDRDDPMTAVEPDIGTTRTSAASGADATLP